MYIHSTTNDLLNKNTIHLKKDGTTIFEFAVEVHGTCCTRLYLLLRSIKSRKALILIQQCCIHFLGL